MRTDGVLETIGTIVSLEQLMLIRCGLKGVVLDGALVVQKQRAMYLTQ
jgi:hypothetical protein